MRRIEDLRVEFDNLIKQNGCIEEFHAEFVNNVLDTGDERFISEVIDNIADENYKSAVMYRAYSDF